MSRKGNVEHNANINYPVDRKARQVVNKEIQVAQLGRTKVKGAEPFNEATANSLLEKHLRKKKKAAPAHFLVDRIRFTKKGFHEYLSYREIQNFHRFPHHPDKFMLFVVEEKKGRRTYESYRCENPTDVLVVRDLISAAHSDPKRLLQDVGPTRLLSVSSSSSSEYYIENRGVSRMSRPRSVQYIQSELPQQYVYQAVEPILQTPPTRVVYRSQYSRPPSVEQRIESVRMPSVRSSHIYEPTRSSAPPSDVTYLRSDNINGPQIMDHGPVYMYVSRSRQNLNRNSWSPDNTATRRTNYY
ncbi:hypothetical protein EG68_01242 [Paragonimus skrjabini miyazakii]|uniref:Trematode PH-like domain-containing protein n=1 Tax=Paragonimus skrjabini miyazakii TaxID=59628 RepID=A0A8S9Z8P9_9TREM|nr:hypothetical protein EG68_01242 [Paragonimus skrjabini miyazakii]